MSRSSKPANLATLFAALADSTRLRLLNLMAGREVCVCYFVEILRQGQPKISRHLAYLRNAGIVAARREGKWMHYRICEPADAGAAAILAARWPRYGTTSECWRIWRGSTGLLFAANTGGAGRRSAAGASWRAIRFLVSLFAESERFR